MWQPNEVVTVLDMASRAVSSGEVAVARGLYGALALTGGVTKMAAQAKLGELAWFERDLPRAKAYLAAAVESVRPLLSVVPASEQGAMAALFSNYAQVCAELGDEAAAVAAYERSLAILPEQVASPLALAQRAARMGDRRAADAYRAQARRAPTRSADDVQNQALLDLHAGAWYDGFRKAEARFDAPLYRGRYGVRLPTPRATTLAECAGKTVLVYHEQGIGDTLQMGRFLPHVRAVAARVVLALPPSLLRLYADAADVVISAETEMPAHDVHVSVFSLPALCLTDDTLPVPWRPPHWPAWHGAGSRRIGLAWKGEPTHLNDAHRSIHAVEALRPLFALPGVTWFRLQRGHPHDLADVPMQTVDVTDWRDTAEIVAGLEAVVCVDTGVAHLAGTTGTPTHVLIAEPPEWRWNSDRDVTPWYPSARLWRQRDGDDWTHPIAALAAYLTETLPHA